MAISIKQRYDQLKAAHRCTKCTRRLEEGYNYTKCPKCREYNRKYLQSVRQSVSKEVSAEKPRRRDGALSLSQVIRLATERHVSYGEMVCILEKEGKA